MRRSISSGATLLAGALALGMIATGCAGSPAPATTDAGGTNAGDGCYEGTALGDTMAEYYDAAVESGKSSVTVYGPGAVNWEPLVENFNQCFPDITVNLVHLVGSEVITRLQAEASSGQRAGDLLFGTINNGVFLPEFDDWFEPFAPVGAEELVHHDEDLWYVPYAGLFGYSYNTASVPEDEVPRTYEDLLDERWKGKIASNNLTAANAGTQTMVLAYLDGRIDDEWMTNYGEQDLRTLPDGAAIGQALVTGEADIAEYPMSLLQANKADGAPVDFIPELSLLAYIPVGLLKDAPNPDAAKLLSSWLMTDQAQADFALQGQYGLMPGAPHPEGLTDENHVINEVADTQETLDAWKHVLGFWSAKQ
ncbi:ABC transporter substrate-binding protein [Microbacterium sp. CPCC 204701]|uniref:ABC transporter substrate-binding protein n=1 Tax=Microbacterium sp. CPCC 204701 TaxID=2493084 RepID=UPI000FD796F5|nr:extracellular solute-binding protein [Microbacterium sp. CPCC 204701]